MESRTKNVSYRTAFSSLGALAGIFFGMKSKNIWKTVGYTLLLSVAGAAIGSAIDKRNEE